LRLTGHRGEKHKAEHRRHTTLSDNMEEIHNRLSSREGARRIYAVAFRLRSLAGASTVNGQLLGRRGQQTDWRDLLQFPIEYTPLYRENAVHFPA